MESLNIIWRVRYFECHSGSKLKGHIWNVDSMPQCYGMVEET